MRPVPSGSRDLASFWLLPADHGGSRATVCGPLPKRSHPVLLPSVHEEVAAKLSQAQAGIQASSAPAGKGPSDPPRWPARSGSRGPCTCVLASVEASVAQPPCPGRFPSRALHSPAVIAACCPPFAPEPGCASRLLPLLSPWHPSHRPAFLPVRCLHRPSLLSAWSSCRVSAAERAPCDLWSAASSLPSPGHLPDGDVCCDLSWPMRPAVRACPRCVPAVGRCWCPPRTALSCLHLCFLGCWQV